MPSSAPAAPPDFRPGFHFSPKANWINDPNGLVYLDGEYHLFYQYNPNGDQWGDIGWGHAVSTDLTHWEELPMAIAADDESMIFSGSAVVDTHNTAGFAGPGETALVAIYTAARRAPQRGQTQCIAYSTDRGRSWTKYRANPVLDIGLPEFRDPKVQWHADTGRWLMAVALPDARQVGFYASADLKQWRHLSDFGPAGAVEGIWECPDLFALDWQGGTAWVLKVDVFKGHVCGSTGSQYFVGQFDGLQFLPFADQPQRWSDYGADFYAALSWNSLPQDQPKPVWIGWMNNHRYAASTPTQPWRGAMSLPRALSLGADAHGPRLLQQPIAQLTARRGQHRQLAGGRIGAVAHVVALDGPLSWEILASVGLLDAGECGIRIGAADGAHTLVGYCRRTRSVFVDRSASGLLSGHPDFPGRRSAALEDLTSLQLHIFIDRCSVEVFVNDGEVVLTELIFPDTDIESVAIYAVDGSIDLLSFDLWQLA